MPAQRNPKDSMTSTWRTDRSQWNLYHWLLEGLGIHPTDVKKEVPVFAKDQKMAYIPQFTSHKWILTHALWPLAIQQSYIYVTGQNFHPAFSFAFYNLAFMGNAIHELHLLRKLGHTHGFLDGDKHARDQIPDHSVGKVVRSLTSTAFFRPLMTVFLAYKTSSTPAMMSWWLPVELGLYGIILDFWFYWYHRCMHSFDGLWRFHRTHHLTKHPNPLLTLYADTEQEIFDIVVIPLMTYGTLKLMGFPMGFFEWWICHQYIVFTELFGHSGVRLFSSPPSTNTLLLRALGAELSTEDHDLHHRQGWKKSMNYGKQTLLWDLAFGTAGKRIEMVGDNIDFNRPVSLPLFWW